MKSFPTYALHNPIAIHQGDRENRNVVKSQVLTLPCSSSSSDSISDYYIPLHYYSYSSTTNRFWISFLDQNFSWFKIRTWVTFSPVYWSWHDTDTYSIFTTGRLQITGVKFYPQNNYRCSENISSLQSMPKWMASHRIKDQPPLLNWHNPIDYLWFFRQYLKNK